MKEEEEEKGRGFKVQDRRRFSAEGEARPDAAQAKPEPEPPLGPRPGADEPATAKAPEAPGAERQAGDEPEINFATFIVGLSTEALAALGEMPHPATGQHGRDLRAARQLIDILGILRDKTRGNLDRDEESLFEAILYDLRMKYVELARQP